MKTIDPDEIMDAAKAVATACYGWADAFDAPPEDRITLDQYALRAGYANDWREAANRAQRVVNYIEKLIDDF